MARMDGAGVFCATAIWPFFGSSLVGFCFFASISLEINTTSTTNKADRRHFVAAFPVLLATDGLVQF